MKVKDFNYMMNPPAPSVCDIHVHATNGITKPFNIIISFDLSTTDKFWEKREEDEPCMNKVEFVNQ